MRRGLALLAATVALLLAVKLFGRLSHPLGIRAYHLWLIGGVLYLVCSLSVLLEAPVRRILRRVASRLFGRRIANDPEITRAAGRLG
ncbi:MAG TPA: hypothetical protein VMA36_13235 [Candidatus Limnocylindria bacterium]|nr:hypothetical protein [Candidatus Limnocylindria bacterium]